MNQNEIIGGTPRAYSFPIQVIDDYRRKRREAIIAMNQFGLPLKDIAISMSEAVKAFNRLSNWCLVNNLKDYKRKMRMSRKPRKVTTDAEMRNIF